MRGANLFLILILGFSLITCSTSPIRFASENRANNPLAERLAKVTCDVWRDPDGVPHTRSTSEQAAYSCLGYLHGKDRAFHLDYIRRGFQGRLSEILGSGRVREDFFVRMLGLAEKAEVIFEEMPQATREYLWAYAYGVNLGMAEAMKEENYVLDELDYDPEVWRPQHSVGILLLQSFLETKNTFTQDLTEKKWIEAWGDRAQGLMTQDGLPWDNSILKAGESPPLKKSASVPGIPVDASFGSNNWVLGSQWSKSGKAWFANDPHVSLQHPSFWYWAHVQGGDLDVAGATVPGMPLVVSGLNRRMAWGLTDSFIKVADVIAIPESDTSGFISQRPTIWIKAGPFQLPFFFKSFQRSPEGYPVLPIDEAPEGKALLLRWSGFHLQAKHLSIFTDLAKAETVEKMDKILSALQLPTFSFVFADNKGGIGYRAVGLLPRDDEQVPFGVREGTLASARSYTFLDSSEAPHILNPGRGYVATANNRVWPAGSTRFQGRAFSHSFRSRRIEELLTSTRANDLESIRRTQCDTMMVDARYLVPRLIQYVSGALEGDLAHAIRLLSEWDFQGGVTCRACGVYVKWVDRIKEKWTVNHPGLYRLLGEKVEEKRRAELIGELRATLSDIREDRDEAFPAWGDLHRAYFEHITGAFSSEDYLETPGNLYSVNVGVLKWRENYYSHYSGAAQRLIVEMTNPPKAYLSWDGTATDNEFRSLNRSSSSWQRWRNCQHQPVRFPLDWTSVKSTSAPLN